jgi:hypothetical protein
VALQELTAQRAGAGIVLASSVRSTPGNRSG